MELKDLFLKLDTLNEHISVLRENTARMGAVLDENTRDIREHIKRTDLLQEEVTILKEQIDKWKGAMVLAVALAGIISPIVTYLLPKILH